MPRRRKGVERRIARERIDVLSRLAEEEALSGKRDRANRYAQLARRIGMRYNVPLPPHLRRLICRGCGSYLHPGTAASVRLRRGRVVIRCLTCGRTYRYPYLRELKARRGHISRR